MSVLSDFGGESTGEIRPEDCECIQAFHDLACWSCWREGFRQPNPDAPDRDSDE